jgi:hypothetical protein
MGPCVLKLAIFGITFLQPAISFGATIYRYTYHGAQEYEVVTPGMPTGLSELSGYIDFTSPLTIGMNVDLSPIAYPLTDGVTTVTEQSGYDFRDFSFIELNEDGDFVNYGLIFEYVFDGPADSRRHVSFGFEATSEHTAYCPDICTYETHSSDGDIAMTSGFTGAGIAPPLLDCNSCSYPCSRLAIWFSPGRPRLVPPQSLIQFSNDQ